MVRVWLITVAMVMMLVTPPSATQSTNCKKVLTSLSPCITYLKEGGTLPELCCIGVKSLDSYATNTAERQEACYCLKAAAKAYSVNPLYAASLPVKCGVDHYFYPISYSTNCSKVD